MDAVGVFLVGIPTGVQIGAGESNPMQVPIVLTGLVGMALLVYSSAIGFGLTGECRAAKRREAEEPPPITRQPVRVVAPPPAPPAPSPPPAPIAPPPTGVPQKADPE